MHKRYSISSLFLGLAMLGLAGCTTLTAVLDGEELVPEAEITALLTNKTWKWNSGGGVYFGRDGNAVINFQGENYPTTWWAEDGRYCYKGDGDRDRCWGLVRRDGEIYQASLWQPEYNNLGKWDLDRELVRGRIF